MTGAYANSWTSVRVPERDLAEIILEVAAPLLGDLGPAAPIALEREVLEIVVSFWNASVRASKRWERRRVKELNELKKQLQGQRTEGIATFDVLTERFNPHWLDPRLVEGWSYEEAATGRHLVCTMGLPDGVRAEVPPPIEKRISIGGTFLDLRLHHRARCFDHGAEGRSLPGSRHEPLLAVHDDAPVRARGLGAGHGMHARRPTSTPHMPVTSSCGKPDPENLRRKPIAEATSLHAG